MTTATTTSKRPGRTAAHPGKNKARAFTLTMTDAGYDAAEAIAADRGMSRNDAIEAVLLESRAAAGPRAARCPHTWTTDDGRTVQCARRVGHEASKDADFRRHVWGAHVDTREVPRGRR